MSSHESYSSSEMETLLLRSDLAEIFRLHADVAAFHQTDNWEQPIEIVLGGMCTFENTEGIMQELYVHIRQRFDDRGINYLIIVVKDNISYWNQINDGCAMKIYDGSETPLDTDELMMLRMFVRPEQTEWITDYTDACAACEGLYEKADIYAGREHPE